MSAVSSVAVAVVAVGGGCCYNSESDCMVAGDQPLLGDERLVLWGLEDKYPSRGPYLD